MPVLARSSRGRHSAPSRLDALLAARPALPVPSSRHLLPAVLLGAMGTSLALTGLTGGSPATAGAPLAASAAALSLPVELPDRGADLDRASRDRRPEPLAPAVVEVPAAPEVVTVEVLPECTGDGSEAAGYANGRLPAAALCPLGIGHHALRADAARAFALMDLAALADRGERLCLLSSYRSLEGQRAVRASKPHLAAVPGRSTHGLGQAVDLGCGAQSFGSDVHRWLRENAGRFGWFLPEWAQPGGSKPEPWHWEYDGRER